MSLVDVAKTLAQVPALLTLKKEMQPRPPDTRDCVALLVERAAARYPNRPAILFEGREMTWQQFNALANRYARVLKTHGVVRGEAVSVFMENRIEFLAICIALNKLGATASLINTNLHGRQLIHCANITDSRRMIFGAELAAPIEAVRDELPLADGRDYFWVADPTAADVDGSAGNWAMDLGALAEQADDGNLPETAEITIGDSAFYIFTSGTTGFPKAAVLSNRRYLAAAAMSHKAGLKCSEKDRLYICLPLYHGTGLMIGVGAAMSAGASMFIRRRFSASNFLDEVRRHRATCFIYIGELCRYLMNTPARPDDHATPLRRAMGNGLRPDIWKDFKRRFGLERIAEFYGASEGNVAFANLLNKDCTVGMTSARHALVRYDVDADEVVRDASGRCIEVAPGEAGLLLGHINPEAVFEGYTSPQETEKKILRNVFEDGDAWFNTGDLLRTVDVGYTLGYPHYQFVDRVGDTFRWKAENVSTNEVGEILNGFPQVRFSNVYGVQIPGADGRAGMAALALDDAAGELDVDAFSAYVNRELPGYARPAFVRVLDDIPVTGTFKLLKSTLREEAYDLDRVRDPVYVMKPGSDRYELLDREYLAVIRRGEAGF